LRQDPPDGKGQQRLWGLRASILAPGWGKGSLLRHAEARCNRDRGVSPSGERGKGGGPWMGDGLAKREQRTKSLPSQGTKDRGTRHVRRPWRNWIVNVVARTSGSRLFLRRESGAR